MTSEEKRQFESQWPAVAARLHRLLARRGIPAERRDDIVQETGLRLLGSWDRVDAARPLWPLTITIALNLMRDQARRSSWGEILSELPDRQDDTDVEHEAAKRLELRQAGRALALMKQGHRDVLLAELEPSLLPTTASAAATKMLRMRARRRLVALMQQVSALGVAAVGPLRRMGRSSHLLPYRATAEGLAPAVCGVLCALVVTGTASLAPFSALPWQGAVEGEEDLFSLSVPTDAVDGAMVAAASLPSTGANEGSLAESRGLETGPSGTSTDPRGSLPPEDNGIEHKSHYEVPLGNENVANGTVTVEIHHGGGNGVPHPGDGSIDCTEQMITPNEIDVRCWRSGDPQHRYGVRVEHHHASENAPALSGAG